MECASVEDCLSYNFNNSENMENNCQLNKATKDSAPPSDYEEAEGLVYYQASLVVNNILTGEGLIGPLCATCGGKTKATNHRGSAGSLVVDLNQ